jgi:hypothetical protein
MTSLVAWKLQMLLAWQLAGWIQNFEKWRPFITYAQCSEFNVPKEKRSEEGGQAAAAQIFFGWGIWKWWGSDEGYNEVVASGGQMEKWAVGPPIPSAIQALRIQQSNKINHSLY